MKTEPNAAAYPVIGMGYEATGLTKLEAFTMAAMQGMCEAAYARQLADEIAKPGLSFRETIGYAAVQVAKATIEALNKEDNNG